MATLTIRNLDESTKARLRVRAAGNGRSMEAEAREILRTAVGSADDADYTLGDRIHELFKGLGPVDIPPRTDLPREWDL